MKKKVKKRNRHVKHREVQLLALALKLGTLWNLDSRCHDPLERVRNVATQLKITLTDAEIIAAEKYIAENR